MFRIIVLFTTLCALGACASAPTPCHKLPTLRERADCWNAEPEARLSISKHNTYQACRGNLSRNDASGHLACAVATCQDKAKAKRLFPEYFKHPRVSAELAGVMTMDACPASDQGWELEMAAYVHPVEAKSLADIWRLTGETFRLASQEEDPALWTIQQLCKNKKLAAKANEDFSRELFKNCSGLEIERLAVCLENTLASLINDHCFHVPLPQ